MVRIKPFRGIRPREDLAAMVSALPYDVMNRKEAAAMASGNKCSILHVTRAEIDFPAETGDYEDCVYEKGRDNLLSFLKEGILKREEKPVFYIYREIMDGKSQTGIVAAFATEDYENGIVLKHELTRKEKEADRIKHFDVCNCHTEPVFLTYRHRDDVNRLVDDWVDSHEAVYDFASDDGVSHILWVIDDEKEIGKIVDAFGRLEKVYIADGHHRSASAAAVRKIRKEQGTLKGENDPANYFMAVVFPDDDLAIMAYNRVVKVNDDFDPDVFLKKLGKILTVEKMEGDFLPAKKHEFGAYIRGSWYRLTADSSLYQNDDVADNLDAAILQKNVLGPLLDIGDPRTDKRIDFVGGIRGNKEIMKRCDQEQSIGFNLFPVDIADLMSIADAGKIMPPKSTWFEPKIRSGLFLHSLNEE
jgi:uncharacterized protein (DUF1015 family)